MTRTVRLAKQTPIKPSKHTIMMIEFEMSRSSVNSLASLTATESIALKKASSLVSHLKFAIAKKLYLYHIKKKFLQKLALIEMGLKRSSYRNPTLKRSTRLTIARRTRTIASNVLQALDIFLFDFFILCRLF